MLFFDGECGMIIVIARGNSKAMSTLCYLWARYSAFHAGYLTVSSSRVVLDQAVPSRLKLVSSLHVVLDGKCDIVIVIARDHSQAMSTVFDLWVWHLAFYSCCSTLWRCVQKPWILLMVWREDVIKQHEYF